MKWGQYQGHAGICFSFLALLSQEIAAVKRMCA